MSASSPSAHPVPDTFKLGKVLAAPEKETRDKGVDILASWLKQKTNPTELDYMKVWRALHYCLWMSDKPIIQHELAQQLAKLLHKPPTPALNLLFIQTFYKTIINEWGSIDKHRFDKYLWLLRFFTYESLIFLKENDYEDELVDSYSMVLLSTCLNPVTGQTHHGLVSHLVDVFLDELTKVEGEEWWLGEEGSLLSLFYPWLQLLASDDEPSLVYKISTDLFEEVIAIWVRARQSLSVAPPGTKETKSLEKKVARLRAFVDDLIEVLWTLATSKETLERNRKPLYSLHSTFKLNLEDDDQQQSTKSKKSNESTKSNETKKSNESATKADESSSIPNEPRSKKRERSDKNSDEALKIAKRSKNQEDDSSDEEAVFELPSSIHTGSLDSPRRVLKDSAELKRDELREELEHAKSSKKSTIKENQKQKSTDKTLEAGQVGQVGKKQKKMVVVETPPQTSSDDEVSSDDQNSDQEVPMLDFDEDIDSFDIENGQLESYDEEDDSEEEIQAKSSNKNQQKNQNNKNQQKNQINNKNQNKNQNKKKPVPAEANFSSEDEDDYDDMPKFVKTPSPKSKQQSGQKTNQTPKSSSKKVTWNSTKDVKAFEDEDVVVAKKSTHSPPARSILKPCPPSPFSPSQIKKNTELNGQTDFPSPYAYMQPESRILVRPPKLSPAEKKQIKQMAMKQLRMKNRN